MINTFLTWWAEQLLSWLPAGLRSPTNNALGPRNAVVNVTALPATGPLSVELHRRRVNTGPHDRHVLDVAGLASLKASAAGLAKGVTLRVPIGVLLEQTIRLPLAAEQETQRVLAYEMDRLTPFAASDLYWAWEIERRNRLAGQLHVRLTLVPRARLATLLGLLAEAGLRPTTIEGQVASGAIRRLQPEDADRTRLARHGLAIAASACAVLAVATVATPFLMQARSIAVVEARITDLRPQVAQAEALRKNIRERAGTTDIIEALRLRTGDALSVLAALTNVLPDDTALTDLSLRSRALVISGESAAAVRLIAALAAEPGLRNPTFTAPVTRGAGGRGEAFSISAEVAP
jgi:general secretion pathway protein L